jgi:hypothetical protein
MCSTGPTTSYGYELQIADDAGIDDVPVCCDEDMTGKDTKSGGRDYTCSSCSTVVMIKANGLVDDIIEKQAA